MQLNVPGRGALDLEHLVLDLNGTIALDGRVAEGVAEGVDALRGALHVVAITADTHGTAESLRKRLGIDVHVITPGDEAGQKRAFVESLGPERVVAAGNGANDVEMLERAALGICVVGDEGAATGALAAADVVVPSARALFGLLTNPARLVATLRR